MVFGDCLPLMTFHGHTTRKANGRHSIKCQSTTSGRISLGDLLTVASAMNIKRPREIIEKIIDVVAHWSDYATPLGIPQETIGAIKSTIITRL